MLKTLSGLNREELCVLVQEDGELAYRGKQLAEWIYEHGARTFEEMTNLPDKLRAHLSREYEIGRSQIIGIQHSRDGTIKLLLAFHHVNRRAIEDLNVEMSTGYSECGRARFHCGVRRRN